MELLSAVLQSLGTPAARVDYLIAVCKRYGLSEAQLADLQAQRDLMIQRRLVSPSIIRAYTAEQLVRLGMTPEAAVALKKVYPAKAEPPVSPSWGAAELELRFPLIGVGVDALLQACQEVLSNREAAAVRSQRDVMVENVLIAPGSVARRSTEDLVSAGLTPEAAAALKRVCSSSDSAAPAAAVATAAQITATELEQQQPELVRHVDQIVQACQKLLTAVDAAHVRSQRDVLIQQRLSKPETFAVHDEESLVSTFGLTPEAAAALKLVYPSTAVMGELQRVDQQLGSAQLDLVTTPGKMWIGNLQSGLKHLLLGHGSDEYRKLQ